MSFADLDILELDDDHILFRLRGVDGAAEVLDGAVQTPELLVDDLEISAPNDLRETLQEWLDDRSENS